MTTFNIIIIIFFDFRVLFNSCIIMKQKSVKAKKIWYYRWHIFSSQGFTIHSCRGEECFESPWLAKMQVTCRITRSFETTWLCTGAKLLIYKQTATYQAGKPYPWAVAKFLHVINESWNKPHQAIVKWWIILTCKYLIFIMCMNLCWRTTLRLYRFS